ncbi:hypothetical protein D3C84_752940 [compost metagenome]
MLVVLCLDYSDRQVGLMVEDEVCTACFAPAVKFAPDDNAAFGKADFLAHLLVHVPSSLLNGWGDVLAADVPLGKRLFVHNPNSLSSRPGRSIPAQLIVLDGRKCTLFDSGTGEDQILVVEAVGKMSRGHDSASVLRRPDSFIWDRSLPRAEDG